MNRFIKTEVLTKTSNGKIRRRNEQIKKKFKPKNKMTKLLYQKVVLSIYEKIIHNTIIILGGIFQWFKILQVGIPV